MSIIINITVEWYREMNGRLDKVTMTAKLTRLKIELADKCKRNEMGEWECIGADKYLNKALDVLEEFYM